MFCSFHRGSLLVAVLGWSLFAVLGSAPLLAQDPEGTESTFVLVLSPDAFRTFSLPDSEDAIGILLAGPSGSSSDILTTASGNFGSWGGTYIPYKTVKYIAKGGVASVGVYFESNGAWPAQLPPCLKIGADRGLIVEYYYASLDGNGNLIEDPEGGTVLVFVHGKF